MAENGQDPGRKAWKEFSSRLRSYRTKQGLSQERLAERLTYSESAVGHVERMMRKPSEELTREIEKALGLHGQLLELLPQIHNSLGPKWFQEWPRVEAAAHTIRTSEPMIIPGLLQTESYARRVFLGKPGATEDEAEKAVQLRIRRQSVFLRKPPPMYSSLVDENVLHRPVGGKEVMREQLAKILEILNPPYVTVRVLPLAAGLTTGLLGAFEVATLRDGGPDHAYIESAEEGLVTNRTQTVQALIVRWDALSNMAHPVDASREIIREVMSRYE
ncbi:helix-turn-helix domain-containing protein [Nonomuraea guangzhouensis]|uniref:Scr1 family TA system antitoxin-like transcriptional regulator n=1 Tax=Nonomuraea guangzhouensis TaxID=1291555 RepID=A0ABW4G620_9ACTN|nr:helix-turn-helix transcriptional regulator [Nonomuraea guangzhouensis]